MWLPNLNVTRTQACMRCSFHPKFSFLHFIGNYFRKTCFHFLKVYTKHAKHGLFTWYIWSIHIDLLYNHVLWVQILGFRKHQNKWFYLEFKEKILKLNQNCHLVKVKWTSHACLGSGDIFKLGNHMTVKTVQLIDFFSSHIYSYIIYLLWQIISEFWHYFPKSCVWLFWSWIKIVTWWKWNEHLMHAWVLVTYSN
jgi:DNA segregation ATPase FtsK/SpoIIIE-like protein